MTGETGLLEIDAGAGAGAEAHGEGAGAGAGVEKGRGRDGGGVTPGVEALEEAEAENGACHLLSCMAAFAKCGFARNTHASNADIQKPFPSPPTPFLSRARSQEPKKRAAKARSPDKDHTEAMEAIKQAREKEQAALRCDDLLNVISVVWLYILSFQTNVQLMRAHANKRSYRRARADVHIHARTPPPPPHTQPNEQSST